MLLVLCFYAGFIWLIFFRLKLLPWNRMTKGVVYAGALGIALTVIGALNYLAPRGPVSVQAIVVEITPNVSGTVIEVAVEPNQRVEEGDLLFAIDRTPFEAEVERLEAALLEARSSADQLQSDLLAAEADIERLEAQLEFGIKRRDDLAVLTQRGAGTEFRIQEAISTIDQAEAGLRAAQATKKRIETRIAAQVDGVDTAIVQAEEQLRAARWTLDQTEVRAPSAGHVAAVTLQTGTRVTSFRPALGFVPDGEVYLVARFSQTGLHAIGPGDDVMVALRSMPGTFFVSEVENLPLGTEEGAFVAGGGLPTIRQVAGIAEFAARIKIPTDVPTERLRLGISGTAMRISENAGPIEPLAKVLFWVARMRNYL